MHLKRNEVPLSWPIPRKGTKFVVSPSHNKREGIPLLILVRDILKLAKNRKEVKKILNDKKIKVNEKVINDERFSLLPFDILSIGEKDYKLLLKNKKFNLEETKQIQKTCKIVGKKILNGNKVQMNLNDGRNFISKEKVKIGDSVILNLKEKKILKILPLKTGGEIIIIKGKHLGEKGKIQDIDEKNKTATIVLKEGKINLTLDKVMVI